MSYFESFELRKECSFLLHILEILTKKKGTHGIEWSDNSCTNNEMIKNLLERDYPQLFNIAQEVLFHIDARRLKYIAETDSKDALSSLNEYELAWYYAQVFSDKRTPPMFMSRFVAESIAEQLLQDLPNRNVDKIFCCSESALSVLLALSKHEVQIDFAILLRRNNITGLFIELIKLIGKAKINVINFESDFKSTIMLPLERYKVGYYAMPMGLPEHWLLHQENYLNLATHSTILLEPGVTWSSKRDFYQLRQDLVETHSLKAVIQLPVGVISATNLSPTLLLLNKDKEQRTNRFLFADFSSEKLVKNKDAWSIPFKNLENTRTTSIDEIRANDYVLDPKRYEFGEGSLLTLFNHHNSEPLSSIADIIRAQSIPISNEANISSDIKKYHEVSPSDIDDIGFVAQPKKVILVAEEGKRRASQAELHENDIVLAIKGSIGKVGLITENTFEEGCPCVAGQSFVIIRLKPYKWEEYSPEYLFRYLKTRIVQKYFESFSLGTTIRMLKMSDVTGLPVKIPSQDELLHEKKLHREQIRIKREILEMQNKLYQSEMNWPK